MSSPDNFTPRFDDFNNGAPAEDDDQWWAESKPKKTSKKKGKKAKKYVDTFAGQVEEEDIPFARAIASSPPRPPPLAEPEGFHGIDLHEDDFPSDRAALEESIELRPPSTGALEDELSSLEEPEPPPKPVHATSPTVRSPRRTPAKPQTASISPATRQATLYGSPPQYGNIRSPQQARSSISPAKPTREFVPANASPRNNFVEPSGAPHKAQPHFYGLPDIDLNLGLKKEQNIGNIAGSDQYCCSFDSFADSGDETSSKKARDALLVGSEGGLEVFRVLPNKLEVVGRLEGLRGSVIGAKILPHTDLFDSLQLMRPLVAVIVHGFMIEEKADSGFKTDRGKNRGVEEPARFYQTTVEVYSLQTQQYVATLYKSLPAAVEQPTFGQLSSLPEPVGDLRITAQGRFVVLASGKSGEVFVFTYATGTIISEGQFRCIGKYWTTLQSPLDNPASRPQSSNETAQTTSESNDKMRTPLLALSQRWLALVPPATSSRVSIQGSSILSERNTNPPGVASAVAPPQPGITCDIAGLESEDAWSRLTRQAARGVVKYSQKGIDLGWQGWKELTNPTTPSAQHGRTPSKESDELFPPTNAPPDDPKRTTREPAIVSVIDLVALLEAEDTKSKYPPAPLASFPLREGCNFLSLSSNGLRLLTVSRKGEFSTIWDLSQSCHGSQKQQEGMSDRIPANDPSVKQVLRIPRNSPSVVVDCAWSRDDEHLALLTTHGTIHLHEVPARSASRKRKRRSTTTAPAPEKAQAVVSVSHGSSPPSSNGGFLSSLKFGWQQMSSQVASLHTQNSVSSFGIPTSFAGFKEVTASAGHASGRALAKGLSQGLSAAKGGASDYWHADDNKIRHKALQDHENAGSLKWIKLQSDLLLAVVCAGTVHLHPVQRVERRKGDAMVSGLKRDKYGQKHFALPSIRTRAAGDAPNVPPPGKKAREDETCAQQGPHGFWSLRPLPAGNEVGRQTSESRTTQPSEVETNPPYCPFHIDPRVDIFAFDDDVINSIDSTSDQHVAFHIHGHGSEQDDDGWIFGEPLPSSTKMNTHEDLSDIRRGFDPDSDGDIDIDLSEQVESTLTVRTAAGEVGGEEIRINSWRSQGKLQLDDGEFEVVEDGDDDDDSELGS